MQKRNWRNLRFYVIGADHFTTFAFWTKFVMEVINSGKVASLPCNSKRSFQLKKKTQDYICLRPEYSYMHTHANGCQ